MKTGVISLGCAKNLVDTENLLGILKASGVEIVTSFDEAEVIIINTCGFIESAKVESINTILNIADLKENNLKKLIVMGCLSQRYKTDLEEEMPEVDRFIAIDEYDHMADILSEEYNMKIEGKMGETDRLLSGKPWMAYLQISDGCDNVCSYCAIPKIRGKLRSVPMDEIIKEAKRLISIGVKEITLVAQDCSRYGFDMDRKLHLTELLKELDDLSGIEWIRLLYLYPDEIPEGLIETIRDSKHILPYFDIPVQSGSNHVLNRMKRKTNRERILNLIETIRKEIPEASLRTTLIAGFPGETEEDHQETVDLVKKAQFNHLGVFTFSAEEGTAAYEMEDDVSEEEKERRRFEIMDLQEGIAEEMLKKQIGKEAKVLVEGRNPLNGMYTGRSYAFAPDGVDGYVLFRALNEHDYGEFVNVRFTKISGQNLIGEER